VTRPEAGLTVSPDGGWLKFGFQCEVCGDCAMLVAVSGGPMVSRTCSCGECDVAIGFTREYEPEGDQSLIVDAGS
jgi:hypothetical protein